MPDYTVTNAGSPAFNDDYTEGVGLYNGKPWYEGDANGMFLYYGDTAPPGDEGWVLHATKETLARGFGDHLENYAYYKVSVAATPDEASYTAGSGDAPDADVAVYAAAPEVYSRDGSVDILFDVSGRRSVVGKPYSRGGSVDILFDVSGIIVGPYRVHQRSGSVDIIFDAVGSRGGRIMQRGGSVDILFDVASTRVLTRGPSQSEVEWDFVRGRIK